jgi:hypothetical protein
MLQCKVKDVMVLEDFWPEVWDLGYQSLALLVQRLESLVPFTFCMTALVSLGASQSYSPTLYDI